MSDLTSFIEYVCVQSAVYWGSPIADGYGGLEYSNPVEIQCRWEGKTRLIRTNEGNEIVSKAEVMVVDDLEENGMLWLGSLAELAAEVSPTAVNEVDPRGVSNAWKIQMVNKIPLFRSTDKFVKKVYL